MDHKEENAVIQNEEITSVVFQWRSSFFDFSIEYDGIHITILKNEIQVRKMLAH